MDGDNVKESSPSMEPVQQQTTVNSGAEFEEVKKPWWHPVIEPGHAVQIIIAAILAIAIGLGVSAGVGQENIPDAAPAILEIPGNLWLRALQAVGKLTLYSPSLRWTQKLTQIQSCP